MIHSFLKALSTSLWHFFFCLFNNAKPQGGKELASIILDLHLRWPVVSIAKLDAAKCGPPGWLQRKPFLGGESISVIPAVPFPHT